MTQNHNFFPAITQLPFLTAVKGPLVVNSRNSLGVKSAHLETLAGTSRALSSDKTQRIFPYIFSFTEDPLHPPSVFRRIAINQC
jgi:hypothetical protein